MAKDDSIFSKMLDRINEHSNVQNCNILNPEKLTWQAVLKFL